MSSSPERTYLTGPQTSRRYGITDRSLSRWEGDERLAFPKAMTVNNRKFFALDELEAWERARATRSLPKVA